MWTVKQIIALAILATCSGCGGGGAAQYDGIALVLGNTAQPHAERIVADFIAIWPLNTKVVVYEEDFNTFDEAALEQRGNYATAYIGDLTDDMANGPSDICPSCPGGFTGLSFRSVSLNAISHRGNLERLPTLLSHEIGHQCSLGHQSGTFLAGRLVILDWQMERLVDCFMEN